MKNLNFIWGIVGTFALTSCSSSDDDFIIWDFTNLGIDIEVISNTTGENLLDPKTEGNILGNDITIEYNNNVYEIYNLDNPVPWVSYDDAGPKTRFNMPVNLGLRYISGYLEYNSDMDEIEFTENLHLAFGEFDTTGDFHQEQFRINWGDGTSNIVVFDCYVKWKGKTNPIVHHDIWLDGEKVEGYTLKIYR